MGRGSAVAAHSVNAQYFQHEGTQCHVIAGWRKPKSVRITEIPQIVRVGVRNTHFIWIFCTTAYVWNVMLVFAGHHNQVSYFIEFIV